MLRSVSLFTSPLPALLLSAVAIALAAGKPPLRWTQGKDLSLAKGGYASGFFDGKLVLAGGTHWKDGKKLWLDEVVAYDPSNDRWEALTPLPKPLAYGASAEYKNAFYYLGGAGPEHSERAGYRLTRQKQQYRWEQFTTLPRDRCYARAVVLGDLLLLAGGSDDINDLSKASNTLLALSLAEHDAAWKTLAPIPGPGRAVFAATACAGKLYVFGGCQANARGEVRNLGSAYQYDPGQNRWSALKDTPAPTRAWSASSPDDRHIYLFGGYSESASSGSPVEGRFETRVFRFDTVTQEYQEMTPLPRANADMSFHSFQGAFYGAGGEPKGKERAPWTFIGRW